jgi:hypothetical protein
VGVEDYLQKIGKRQVITGIENRGVDEVCDNHLDSLRKKGV